MLTVQCQEANIMIIWMWGGYDWSGGGGGELGRFMGFSPWHWGVSYLSLQVIYFSKDSLLSWKITFCPECKVIEVLKDVPFTLSPLREGVGRIGTRSQEEFAIWQGEEEVCRQGKEWGTKCSGNVFLPGLEVSLWSSGDWAPQQEGKITEAGSNR